MQKLNTNRKNILFKKIHAKHLLQIYFHNKNKSQLITYILNKLNTNIKKTYKLNKFVQHTDLKSNVKIC